MTRIILIHGLVTGTIIIFCMTMAISFGGRAGSSVITGYLIMLTVLSLLFLGVKRYRDEVLGGVVSFGRAFAIGTGIALVATIAYIAGWEIYLALTSYSFTSDYAAAAIAAARDAGASTTEIAELSAKMAGFVEQYKRPLFRFGMTAVELLPVALLVALVSALLLRNSTFMPARGPARN